MTENQTVLLEENIDFSSYQNLGRLHLVKKSKKEFSCRVCVKNIPMGSMSYRQHVYPLTGKGFPMDSRVCESCGKFMIDKVGIKVKEPEVKEMKH